MENPEGGRGHTKNPFRGGVWIFSGTTHYTMALADSQFDDFCLQCIQFVQVIIWFLSFNLELICTSEFSKKLKLHEPIQQMQFRFLKNSQMQISSKLNEKNRMITY